MLNHDVVAVGDVLCDPRALDAVVVGDDHADVCLRHWPDVPWLGVSDPTSSAGRRVIHTFSVSAA